jgi:lysophospholipase L1-like esterase
MRNVLIIGDSISLGYTPEVARILKERALVSHSPGNAQYSSYGLRHLRSWLGGDRWDIIHFNWGIWDLHYLEPSADPLEPSTGAFNRNGVRRTTPEQYGHNLEAILRILMQTAAKLIWASTTPLPESVKIACRKGEEVLYNSVAQRVMEAHGIAVNDLYGHALREIGRIQPPDDVHFTEEGYRYLGQQVASVIARMAKGMAGPGNWA